MLDSFQALLRKSTLISNLTIDPSISQSRSTTVMESPFLSIA